MTGIVMLYLNSKILLVLSKICTFYIRDKQKRRFKQQNINMFFGQIPEDLENFCFSVHKKHSELLNQADDIDTIFLGDSHAVLGCLPFLFGQNAYNYAFTANGLYEIYNSLKSADKACPNLKNIFCMVSFYQRGYSEIRGSLAKYCHALYKILGFEYYFSANKKYNYKSADCIINRILQKLENPPTGEGKTLYSQGFSFGGLKVFPIHKKDRERAEHHFKIYKNYTNELIWLQKICEYAKEHNLKLYLINSPVRSDYEKIISELSNGEDILSDIKNICAENNIEFFDFNSEFNDEDLADTDHLNFNGALKLTRKLLKIIN